MNYDIDIVIEQNFKFQDKVGSNSFELKLTFKTCNIY